jgi:hypothetical protein
MDLTYSCRCLLKLEKLGWRLRNGALQVTTSKWPIRRWPMKKCIVTDTHFRFTLKEMIDLHVYCHESLASLVLVKAD